MTGKVVVAVGGIVVIVVLLFWLIMVFFFCQFVLFVFVAVIVRLFFVLFECFLKGGRRAEACCKMKLSLLIGLRLYLEKENVRFVGNVDIGLLLELHVGRQRPRVITEPYINILA